MVFHEKGLASGAAGPGGSILAYTGLAVNLGGTTIMLAHHY